MSVRPLPPVAARVDAELVEIDEAIDWLYYLSPLGNDQMWQAFVDSGYLTAPTLAYHPVPEQYVKLRERLEHLPVHDIEEPLLRALLYEKQKELELQVELVLARETSEFVAVSLELFGGGDPLLSQAARKILREVPPVEGPPESAGVDELVAVAEKALAHYRAQAPDLPARVCVMDDLNSMMMVHHGHLEVAKSLQVAPERIAPLVAHEVGTHIVTRYNGWRQTLKQFEVGLAHYDALQEGLGTLAEYLTGFLPARRLRVIAARVVASDLVLKRYGLVDIFAALHEDYLLPTEDAFDVAVRARRGGGLTKDAVYLKGLRDLLAYLAEGGDLRLLYLGKFALEQTALVEELLEQGWLVPPCLTPQHLQDPSALVRLERVRDLPLESLFQGAPES